MDESHHAFRALRQDLVDMPVRGSHDVKRPNDEFIRYAILKQVTHGVHKYFSRACPGYGLEELVGDKSNIKSKFVGMSRDSPPPFRERGRVTVLAARADLDATPDRIPSCVRPLNCQ